MKTVTPAPLVASVVVVVVVVVSVVAVADLLVPVEVSLVAVVVDTWVVHVADTVVVDLVVAVVVMVGVLDMVLQRPTTTPVHLSHPMSSPITLLVVVTVARSSMFAT